MPISSNQTVLDRTIFIPIDDDQFIRFVDALRARNDLSSLYSSEQLREINQRAEVLRERKDSNADKLHQLPTAADPQLVSELLRVRDVIYPLDKIASKARARTDENFRKLIAKGQQAAPNPDKYRILSRGITPLIQKVTKRVNARALDDVDRALLSVPAIYELLLIRAIDEENVEKTDEQGLFDTVLRLIKGDARRYFLNEIIGTVLDLEDISLKDDELKALQKIVFEKGMPLRIGSVRAAVVKQIGFGQELGTLRKWVDRFAAKSEIETEQFTESIRNEMARFLLARGIQAAQITEIRFDAGEYDEYFALAYYHATRVEEGEDDPVDIARKKGAVTDWDFKIRRISDTAKPDINALAIRAAGALYATYVEGELMRVYDIGDALLTEWHRGSLDIPDGKAAALLNRYEILMRDRPSEEERQMHFKRVFNIGETEMLSGTVVNEAFPALWDNMMHEVTRYIDKAERYYTDEKIIRRTDVYHTVQELQYNLSEYMTGSTPKKTTEMYRHLDEALEIIGSDDVLNHVGGRRRSILSVIERIGREALEVGIPAQNLVTIAERGNDIFQFIADFEAENVSDDDFFAFIDACKAWIISQGALEPEEESEEYDSPRYENGHRARNGAMRRSANGNHRSSMNGDRELEPAGAGGRSNGNFDDWDS